jgi:cobaltochelatase CobN
VVLLLFAGQQIWFHSIATDGDVMAIFDYVEAMVRADQFFPPPEVLAPHVFNVFDWATPETVAASSALTS